MCTTRYLSIYIYKYICIHTHTHTHIYIYIYVYILLLFIHNIYIYIYIYYTRASRPLASRPRAARRRPRAGRPLMCRGIPEHPRKRTDPQGNRPTSDAIKKNHSIYEEIIQNTAKPFRLIIQDPPASARTRGEERSGLRLPSTLLCMHIYIYIYIYIYTYVYTLIDICVSLFMYGLGPQSYSWLLTAIKSLLQLLAAVVIAIVIAVVIAIHTCHILPPSEIDLGLCLAGFAGSGGKYLFHRIG